MKSRMEKIKLERDISLWAMGLFWTLLGIAALTYEYPYEEMYLGMFTLVLSIAPIFLLVFHLRDRKRKTV
jgi:hypothetical protein